MDKFKENRQLMKSNFRLLQEIQSDQDLKLPQPPLEEPFDENSTFIELPKVNPDILSETNIYTCLKKRRSNGKFTSRSAFTGGTVFFALGYPRRTTGLRKKQLCHLSAGTIGRRPAPF